MCCAPAISYISSSIPHLFSNQLSARSKIPSLIRLWTLKDDNYVFFLSRDFLVFFFFLFWKDWYFFRLWWITWVDFDDFLDAWGRCWILSLSSFLWFRCFFFIRFKKNGSKDRDIFSSSMWIIGTWMDFDDFLKSWRQCWILSLFSFLCVISLFFSFIRFENSGSWYFFVWWIIGTWMDFDDFLDA